MLDRKRGILSEESQTPGLGFLRRFLVAEPPLYEEGEFIHHTSGGQEGGRDEEEEWGGAGRTLRADPPLQWGLGHKKPPQETQP